MFTDKDTHLRVKIFLHYLRPLIIAFLLLAILFGAGLIVFGKDEAITIASKINSRSIAVLLSCVGLYVGLVLVFENVTEPFGVAAKGPGLFQVRIATKSVGGLVIVTSLLVVCFVALAEIKSSQTIICNANKLELDKFLRPPELTEIIKLVCPPIGKT